MNDLFANEAELRCSESIVLTDIKSHEDPVLKDQRILRNILERQNLNDINPDYFDTVQTEVKPHMRKIVSDWMLEVCEEQQCQSEVFSLAINYMDRFLSRVNIQKNQFQLLACVCMFLASKFKETAPLPAENLVIYTDNSVTTYEITQWELLVLQVLGWELSAVTPYSILDHLLRSLSLDPSFNLDMVRRHAETFVALAATEHIFCQKSPAVVAVACLSEALRGLNSKRLDEIQAQLQFITGVEKDMIQECMAQISVCIKLSMSGESFQPSGSSVVPPPAPAQSAPKIIKKQQQANFYPHAQSTTPTDLVEISSTCVY